MQAMDRTPKMHEGNMSHDVLGVAYQYLLKPFPDGSGTRAGQFFTPREVVELIVEVLAPKSFESVYDPTCESGGMLIASAAGQCSARRAHQDPAGTLRWAARRRRKALRYADVGTSQPGPRRPLRPGLPHPSGYHVSRAVKASTHEPIP
ncbi:class I SAM-dependent DNA methyltransferase [Micromonospora krabiensis]